MVVVVVEDLWCCSWTWVP